MDEFPFSRILRWKNASLGNTLPFSREVSSRGRLGEEGSCFAIR